jgi:hypothetical protein
MKYNGSNVVQNASLVVVEQNGYRYRIVSPTGYDELRLIKRVNMFNGKIRYLGPTGWTTKAKATYFPSAERAFLVLNKITKKEK